MHSQQTGVPSSLGCVGHPHIGQHDGRMYSTDGNRRLSSDAASNSSAVERKALTIIICFTHLESWLNSTVAVLHLPRAATRCISKLGVSKKVHDLPGKARVVGSECPGRGRREVGMSAWVNLPRNTGSIRPGTGSAASLTRGAHQIEALPVAFVVQLFQG